MNGIAGVVRYDIAKNDSKEMPQLPFSVNDMATVTYHGHAIYSSLKGLIS